MPAFHRATPVPMHPVPTLAITDATRSVTKACPDPCTFLQGTSWGEGHPGISEDTRKQVPYTGVLSCFLSVCLSFGFSRQDLMCSRLASNSLCSQV